MLEDEKIIHAWTKDGCVRCNDLSSTGTFDFLAKNGYQIREWKLEPFDWQNLDELQECSEGWSEACLHSMFLYGDRDMPWVFFESQRLYGQEAFDTLKKIASDLTAQKA